MSVIEASMAIQQTKKQSDLEKRLKILRQQFYGKASHITPQSSVSHLPHSISNSDPLLSDAIYLRADLMKISILATTALTLQIVLYFLIKNNVLNINLF